MSGMNAPTTAGTSELASAANVLRSAVSNVQRLSNAYPSASLRQGRIGMSTFFSAVPPAVP